MKLFLLKLTALALAASTGVSSHELRGSEVETTNFESNQDSIHCNWKSSDDKGGHGKACRARTDGHTVPYTCDGDHTRVCCTRSGIKEATIGSFGNCHKGRSSTPRPPAPTPLAPAPTHPVPTPTSPTTKSNTLKCNWKSSDDKGGHRKACKARTNGNIVPYVCDGEHARICCNDSTIEKASMENFGNCHKVGTQVDEQASIN